ncbi:DUF4190 domain-containing protein [Streptomyces sp. NPDC048297]|uniref:DUF4190 domain-containing protein n=1 Tax=Streptomyces sp. NPDC048297 TaxID=3365531 RepID=UPI0037168CF4
MTDGTQPGAGGGAGSDPWAPPESKPSLEKQAPGQQPPVQGQVPPAGPPSVHDQATMISMPTPGYGTPGAPGTPAYGQPAAPGTPAYGQPGTPSAPGQGWGGPTVPPPPVAPAAPSGYGYPAYPSYPHGYGQQGYPQQGYGWSMPMAPQNGMGTAAMVLGILSCVLFCFYGLPSLALGITAVILGVKGKKRADRGEATNRSQAQAGFITGIIGTVLGVAAVTFYAIVIIAAVNDDGNSDSGTDPYYNSAPSVSAPVLPQ